MASKQKTFEEAMNRLEEIVELLEDNEQPLDATIDLFEEGLTLIKECDVRLKKYEERIDDIVQKNGSLDDE